MKSRLLFIGAILVSVCLMGAIQKSHFVGSLQTSEGDFLAESDGRLVLLRGRRGVAPRMEDVPKVWRIGAPYLQTSKDKFLTLDQSESGVKVRLADKSDSAKWVIEVLESTSATHPKTGSIDERQMFVGSSKKKFRLSIFDGRFKGWYLSAETLPEDNANTPANVPIIREFRVTQDPKQATNFKYVDTTYSIDHK